MSWAYVGHWVSIHFADERGVTALHQLEVFEHLFERRWRHVLHLSERVAVGHVVLRRDATFPEVDFVEETLLETRHFEVLWREVNKKNILTYLNLLSKRPKKLV